MDLKRRVLLKGITATAAASMIAPRVAFADPIERALITLRETSAGDLVQKPVTAVATESFKASVFMAAIRVAQPAKEVILKAPDFSVLQQLLTQKDTNLVGIIDHANAAVLVQLCRQYDAKIHWLGQHATYGKSTSHNIFKSGDGQVCHRSLIEGLGDCESQHAVREQGLNATQVSGNASAAHSQAWAAQLALALHDLGKGGESKSFNPVSSQIIPQQIINGSAVTFLIETC